MSNEEWGNYFSSHDPSDRPSYVESFIDMRIIDSELESRGLPILTPDEVQLSYDKLEQRVYPSARITLPMGLTDEQIQKQKKQYDEMQRSYERYKREDREKREELKRRLDRYEEQQKDPLVQRLKQQMLQDAELRRVDNPPVYPPQGYLYDPVEHKRQEDELNMIAVDLLQHHQIPVIENPTSNQLQQIRYKILSLHNIVSHSVIRQLELAYQRIYKRFLGRGLTTKRSLNNKRKNIQIRNYKNGFRTYINDVPVSRKPVQLSMASHQKKALLSDENYDNIKKYSLGDEDINKIIPTLKIIPYNELLQYDTIDDALDEKGRLAILYLTESENYGHWICLLKRKKGRNEYIEFFDPYGNYKPDEESEWISNDRLKRFGQDSHYLTKLLRDSGLKITYSKAPFQQDKKNVNTCGRHVACRLYFKHLNLPQYTKMIQQSGMTPDNFVSKFTHGLMGK